MSNTDESPVPAQRAENVTDDGTMSAAISRRKFLSTAALGAGAAIMLNGFDAVAQAQDTETGQVELDALMITYAAAPIGARSTSSWSFTKRRADTMRFSLAQTSGITFTASVTSGFKLFGIGGETTTTTQYQQSNSTAVANAIVLQDTISETFTTTLLNGVAEVGDTVFFGLLKPQMQLDGVPTRFRYRFLKAKSKFFYTLRDLQTPNTEATRNLQQSTIASFLSQYRPLTDPTGATLAKPRFKLKEEISASAGVNIALNRTLSRGSSDSITKSATNGVNITRSVGFTLAAVKAAFTVGQQFQVTSSSVQEVATEKVISVTSTINRAQDGVSRVYWDKAWKTFVIVDLGPSGRPLVQGRITDAFGAPIAGAVVYLTVSDRYYTTATDAAGNYTLAPQSPPDPGSYLLTCGDVSELVAVGGTTSRNLSGVNASIARQSNLDLSLVE